MCLGGPPRSLRFFRTPRTSRTAKPSKEAEPLISVAYRLSFLLTFTFVPVVADEVRDVHLVLDSRIIATVDNAELRVGKVHKHEANPLFKQERPWETFISHMYPNVVFDRDKARYQMWYYTRKMGQPWSQETTPGPSYPGEDPLAGGGVSICYAESRDGITWTKPGLDVILYRGKPTNIVMDNTHGVGVFKDPHDQDPGRRYKAFGSRHHAPPNDNLWVAFSADGIHWSQRKHVGNARGDTHNNAFWAPVLNKYVGITREYPVPLGDPINSARGIRTVLRMESKDFVNWTKPVEVLRGPRKAQTYSMPCFPYAGVYLGLPAIFGSATQGRVQTELAWSPDSKQWHRIDEGAQLIPWSEKAGTYDWGCIYAAATPVILDDEIRIYYSGQAGRHGWNPGHWCLATLRLDGWAGYEAKDKTKPALITTHPVTCSDKTLRVTGDAEDGSIRATLLDEQGKTLAVSNLITGEVTDAAVIFERHADLAKLRGKDLRLKFELTRAKLYSFSFSD